jgi:hypothetical protein
MSSLDNRNYIIGPFYFTMSFYPDRLKNKTLTNQNNMVYSESNL